MNRLITDTPIIAIDFDGTIKSGLDWQDMSTAPVEDAVEVIKELKDIGCELILWTSRTGTSLQDAMVYLKRHGIYECFAAFNSPAPSTNFIQGRKIFANWYVDDLNFGGFPGWKPLLDDVKKTLGVD